MLRPLALIGMMAIAVNTVNAQQPSSCQTCNNSGIVNNAGIYASGSWQYANCDSGHCDSGHCDSGHCDFGHCLGSLCSTKGFPDKGWNPPARLPVNRDGIWYRNYWPQAWYGNAGGAFIANSPMVYQPTDTTQLGYSYAKVPTWQARRMIPPTPCPANYHARVCVPRRNCGRLIDGCPSGNPCQSGTCQSCQQGFTMNALPGYGMQQAAMISAPPAVPQLNQIPMDVEAFRTSETPVAIDAPQVTGDVTNVAFHKTQTASPGKKKGLFHLSRLKSLFGR